MIILQREEPRRIIKSRRSNLTDEKEESAFPFDWSTSGPAAVQRFAREELVACAKCVRANAPTRMNCLYCGAPLPSTARTVPVLKPLESWEPGFNIVFLPSESVPPTTEAIDETAIILRLETERLREIIATHQAMPLARAASLEEARLIENRLAAFKLQLEIVPDDVLTIEAAMFLVRLRRLEFSDEALTGWTLSDERHQVAWPDVWTLVAGRLFTKRVEVDERRGLPGKESAVVDRREMSDDEGVLDLFTGPPEMTAHWRITGENFDYTCLGVHKKLLARENFVTLMESLRTRAAQAVFDDHYVRLRHLLGSAWPLTERTESGGLRRERPGKFNVEAVTHVSNEIQFTRYARLRHHLAMQQRERRLK